MSLKEHIYNHENFKDGFYAIKDRCKQRELTGGVTKKRKALVSGTLYI